MLRAPPGLVALIDSGVAGLSATAGVDESRAVTVGTPEMPSREAVESHHLTRTFPFASFRVVHAFLDGAEKLHTSATVEVKKPQPRRVRVAGLLLPRCHSDSTEEGTTPTLVLCDGNTTYSLGLMVPRKGLFPYAVRGVCVFLQELGYTRMILKSDGEPSITALVTAVQKEWAGDSKNFQAQLSSSCKSC